jgi:hypothetical protein
MDTHARPAGGRLWQRCRRASLLIAGLMLMVAPLQARAGQTQSTQAQTAGERSIRGIVRDEHGAVLAGVRLAVRSPETARIVTAVTDETGAYHLLDLPPGPYVVRAERRGFIAFARPNVRVRAGLCLGLDVVLKARKTPIPLKPGPGTSTTRAR